MPESMSPQERRDLEKELEKLEAHRAEMKIAAPGVYGPDEWSAVKQRIAALKQQLGLKY